MSKDSLGATKTVHLLPLLTQFTKRVVYVETSNIMSITVYVQWAEANPGISTHSLKPSGPQIQACVSACCPAALVKVDPSWNQGAIT